MSMKFKNTWGSPESGIDQQRSDLFQVEVSLPKQILRQGQARGGGVPLWADHIQWAVEKFPFPARDREAIPVKYLQQTNYQIGGDAQMEPIEMTVRYAFNQRTAELLEHWWSLVSDPKTGAVASSSAIKTYGYFYWLVPNDEILGVPGASTDSAFNRVRAYRLEGCWLKDLKPSDADMTTGNGLVTLAFKMQIDRYYPDQPGDLRNVVKGALNEGA